jgi:hypothetical protein
MRRIVLSPAARPAVSNFCTLSNNGHDFRRNDTEHKTCVLIFPTTSVREKFSHSKTNSAKNKFPQVFMYRTRYSCQILKQT